MNLKKTISPDAISLSLAGIDKQTVLEEMVDLMASSGLVSDRSGALKAIREREDKMSTGMQNGIAIPHAKSDIVNSLVAAVGVHQAGVDFDSLDGEPTHIFIMTLSPAKRAGPHIQFLAEVSRVLSQEETRERVMQASSKEELLQILAG